MANLTPTPGWDNVPQHEISTVAIGGPGGTANAQAQALLNRLEALRGTAAGQGGALVGLQDARGYFATDNVEAATQLLGSRTSAIGVSITDAAYGAVSGADCTAAIIAADAAVAAAGGGVVLIPAGTWKYNSTISRSTNVTWRGVSSLASKLQCTNGTAQIINSGGRGGLEDLYIEGPYLTQATRIAAASTSIGVVDGGATIWVRNVRIKYFKKGYSKTIGYWCEYHKLWLEENGTGFSWDNTGADFCNLIAFYSCTFRQNDRNGIASTAVNNNTTINYIGCDVEANCSEDPATYPQIAIGFARNVNWFGGYAEPGTVSPAPDFWVLSNTSIWNITGLYLGGARKAFTSSSNGTGTGRIANVYFAGGTALITSAVYDFPSCLNITVYDRNTHTAAITLDGAGSQRIASGDQLATRTAPASFTPVLSGTGTAGTFTYTVQVARSSKNGNMRTYAGRITISAITVAPTGNIQISLPSTCINATNIRYTGVLDCSGVTLSGANTYFYGRIDPNTSQMTLFQGGSSSTALQAANITATSQIIWSITYEE